MHAIGKDRPRSKEALIFATHSTHKLLAGISQASQIIVQESENAEARPAHLQRGVPDAHVDVAAVRDHRVVRRVGGDDGAAGRHGAGRGVDHRGARLPPRDAQGRRRMGQGLVVQGLGPERLAPEGMGKRDDWLLRANEKWHGFGNLAPGFNILDPIKATIITPGLDVSGKFAKTGIPASIVTRFLAEHGVIVEKTGLYSFFIMFTIGITKGRWNTLVTALQQFKDDYDKNQPLWRILPEFCRQAAAVRARRPARPVPADPRHVQGERRRARDDRDVPVGHAAGDEAVRRVRVHGAPRDRPRRDRQPRRPRDRRAADALSAGHSAADSRRALQPHDRRVPEVRARASTSSSRASTPTSTASSRSRTAPARSATTWIACGRSSIRANRSIRANEKSPVARAFRRLCKDQSSDLMFDA